MQYLVALAGLSVIYGFRAAPRGSLPGARNDHRLVRAIVYFFQLLDN